MFVCLLIFIDENMADLRVEQPKSLIRPKSWSAEVENAYRFQLAGYRDEREYMAVTKTDVSREIQGFVLLFNFQMMIVCLNRSIDGPRLGL